MVSSRPPVRRLDRVQTVGAKSEFSRFGLDSIFYPCSRTSHTTGRSPLSAAFVENGVMGAIGGGV